MYLDDYIKPSKLIDEMFENTDMTVSTFQVARALLGVADKLSFDGKFPVLSLAASSLMAKAKLSNKRTFYSSIDWLKEHGMIEVKSNGRNKAPNYILHFDRPINSSSNPEPQQLPQDVPQQVPQQVPQDSTPYTDRQDGLDGPVVVVQFINKRVNEILQQNHFQNSKQLVENVSEQLNPLVKKGITPEELTSLFEYVLHDAVNKYGLNQISKPLPYALSVVKRTVGDGTKTLDAFIKKQQLQQQTPETVQAPSVVTDLDLAAIDLSNL